MTFPALTTAEGKLADPDIEWDDVEGDAVLNPPSADDEADIRSRPYRPINITPA